MKEYIIGNNINLRKVSEKDNIQNLITIDSNLMDKNFYLITLKNDEIIGYVTMLNINTLYIIPQFQNKEIECNVLRLILNYMFNELKQEEVIYEVNDNYNNIFHEFNFTICDKHDNLTIYKINKKEYKNKQIKKHKYLTGEDIDMFNDNKYSSHKNICDNHWDGA